MPKRIQRKRSKDWRMPKNTVYVGRPSKFGNPWSLKRAYESGLFKPEFVPQIVVTEYEAWLTREASPNDEHLGYWLKPEMIAQKEYILAHLHELRGKNLACWCPAGQPCHADVLLRLANIACTGLAESAPASQ
jgi:hypothetical protein